MEPKCLPRICRNVFPTAAPSLHVKQLWYVSHRTLQERPVLLQLAEEFHELVLHVELNLHLLPDHLLLVRKRLSKRPEATAKHPTLGRNRHHSVDREPHIGLRVSAERDVMKLRWIFFCALIFE